MSENENTGYSDLLDTANGVLREKFIAVNAYIKEEKNLKIVT